jgi:AcrR family transcriptional regulator
MGVSMTERRDRMAVNAALRRQGILAAARGLLVEGSPAVGGAGQPSFRAPSLRKLAAAAGYSAPALYAYFPDREAIFNALFAEDLPAMGRALKAALADAQGNARIEAQGNARIEKGALALYRHARDNWRIMQLGLNAQAVETESLRPATGRLISALAPLAAALRERAGISAEDANIRTLALFAACMGAAGLEASGRSRALGVPGESVVRFAAQAAATVVAAQAAVRP